MKKAVMLGLVLVGSSAQAQSLQLYGLVDAGVSHMSGLRGGSVNQINSGIMEGSRWGLRGREDLGGGYQAIFTLESRVELDTGTSTNRPVTGTQLPDRVSTPAALGLPDTPVTRATVTAIGAQLANTEFGVNIPGRLFDRQAFVGLITPFGAFLAGRQYTPAFEVAAQFDIFNLATAASPQQLVAFPTGVDIRLSNSAAYRIEKNGFTGSIVAAASEDSTVTGRFIGAGGMYKSDRFAAGLAYNTRNNELGDKSLTNTVAGASLNLGSGTFSTEINLIKDDNPSGLSAVPAAPLNFRGAFFNALRQDARLFHIGYRHMFGANSLALGYNHLDDKRPSNADVASYGAAYTYVLSKRTDLTAAVAHLDNKERGQLALGGNGYLGGVSERAGQDVNSVSFSIRHRF
ncbi:MAG: porin [Pseudomonadota bacterium]